MSRSPTRISLSLKRSRLTEYGASTTPGPLRGMSALKSASTRTLLRPPLPRRGDRGLNSCPLPPRAGLLARKPVAISVEVVGVPGRGGYRAVDLVAVDVASQRRWRASAISVHARPFGAFAVGLGCIGLAE